jgi:hypothetical protein
MAHERKYLGVVGGGYDDPIGTDHFKVVIPCNAPLRHDRVIARWTIISVDTQVWDDERKGRKFEMKTLGMVEDVNISPAHAYEDSRQMAHSDYYADAKFGTTFSSTAEDAVTLIVRSIGHITQDGRDLYGPVRPPERESPVYVAEPHEVRMAVMKPMNLQQGAFTIGGYATLDGLYSPFTQQMLPSHQVFLHGAMFAASGWGKTMAIKHFLREFHNLNPSPAIVVFNIKGSEFYRLAEALPDVELNKLRERSPDAEEIWRELSLSSAGFDPQRVTYYPMGVDIRNVGRVYSLSFSQIDPNEEGQAFLRFIMEPFNLFEASMNYLTEYLFFCKRHFTDRAPREVHHNRAQAVFGQGPQAQRATFQDTFHDFVGILRRAIGVAGTQAPIIIRCGQCNDSISIHSSVAGAINRALGELQRLGVFDIGQAINIPDLMRPGHISVVDVAGLQSGLAQQTFVQYVLHQVFRRANRIFLEARADEPYEGVVIFLDEAWRFFRTPNVLDELETISRMGRSLRVGLWLADQNIPTGEREWNVLNNFRTRIVGSISADRTILKRVMPLEETMLTVLPNLRRGMAIFFNQEYSRIPTPVIIPPCTCYHEGD